MKIISLKIAQVKVKVMNYSKSFFNYNLSDSFNKNTFIADGDAVGTKCLASLNFTDAVGILTLKYTCTFTCTSNKPSDRTKFYLVSKNTQKEYPIDVHYLLDNITDQLDLMIDIKKEKKQEQEQEQEQKQKQKPRKGKKHIHHKTRQFRFVLEKLAFEPVSSIDPHQLLDNYEQGKQTTDNITDWIIPDISKSAQCCLLLNLDKHPFIITSTDINNPDLDDTVKQGHRLVTNSMFQQIKLLDDPDIKQLIFLKELKNHLENHLQRVTEEINKLTEKEKQAIQINSIRKDFLDHIFSFNLK